MLRYVVKLDGPVSCSNLSSRVEFGKLLSDNMMGIIVGYLVAVCWGCLLTKSVMFAFSVCLSVLGDRCGCFPTKNVMFTHKGSGYR